MRISGDPLPGQWQIILNDRSVICLWADGYSQEDGTYTFNILAAASAEEQADTDLVITSETNPANPELFTFAIARIPVKLVANIYTRGWDTPVTPEDLVPVEWGPREAGDDGGSGCGLGGVWMALTVRPP